jgi:isopenicillin-N epimerase
MNRRLFFQLAAGTAAVTATIDRVAAAGRSVKDHTPEEVAADEDFWTEVRSAYTIDRNIVNLNNGHVSPAPLVVQEAMRRYLEYSDMGPWHTMINNLERQIEMVRTRLAMAAGCDREEMAITRNASESLENAQYGIDLKPGDEVLTTNQDYPRMLTTFRQRERREGIVLKTISFPVPPPSMDDLYQRFERAVTPKTKLILVCHITNRTGQIFPIRRICDMAHARNIPVIVDGAHAFNHFPFKISDLDCDYYGVSLHKWTCAPVGTGFLYVKKSRIATTWPLMAATNAQDHEIRKFEEIGTHPAANHDAISQALVFN